MISMKVMTIVGTRPELIRLSRIIPLLDEYCDHVLVHTGQSYDFELNQIFFDDLGIRRPDIFLDSASNSTCAADTIANVISGVDKILVSEVPQAVLILGDTNSSLAALPAKRRHIPIFHMEAGNRSFDLRVPEEINRRVVDHLADINLPYSSIARDYLLREGLPPDQVIKTGSPMYEVLDFYKSSIFASNILEELSLSPYGYFLVSIHREENIENEKNFQSIINILNELVKEFQIPVIVSTHPRTRQRLSKSTVVLVDGVKLLKPFGFFDYMHLQIHSRCVLSDSGTITEESSIMNFPALNLRESHERPEGMEEGSVMLVGLDCERVLQCLNILEFDKRGSERDFRLVYDYDVPNVSRKVLRIIHSYTDYVNRVVWKKY